MALKTKVKVGQVTNLSEARYCAGMGVELLGFPIGSGAHQLSLDGAKEIIGWIAVPQLVFEMEHCVDAHILQQVTERLPTCHIQVSLDHLSLDCIKKIKNHPLMLSAGYESRKDILKRAEGLEVKYIVLKINNLDVDWNEVGAINARIPVLIAHQQPDGVNELIQRPISGLALNGTPETKPGLKEYNHLADILEALEVD